MTLLDRVFAFLDSLRDPNPRTFTRTPDQLLRLHTAPARVERIGTYACCDCCGCGEVHRDACSLHQNSALA